MFLDDVFCQDLRNKWYEQIMCHHLHPHQKIVALVMLCTIIPNLNKQLSCWIVSQLYPTNLQLAVYIVWLGEICKISKKSFRKKKKIKRHWRKVCFYVKVIPVNTCELLSIIGLHLFLILWILTDYPSVSWIALSLSSFFPNFFWGTVYTEWYLWEMSKWKSW